MHFFSDLRAYRLIDLRQDLFVAISIALLVIPQATAYALLANLPLLSGFYSAIFGVFVAGLFSRSKAFISGPSTAVTMLVQTAIASLSKDRIEAIGLVDFFSHLLFLTGCVHIILSLCNISKCLQFVSRPVMLGYFAGLSVVICVEQLFHFLQIPSAHTQAPLVKKMWDLLGSVSVQSFPCLILGACGLIFLFYFRKKMPSFPAALAWIIAASTVTCFVPYLSEVPTLRSYTPLAFSVKAFLPSFRKDLLEELFPFALAIAFLGVLEAFSVSKALSIKTKEPVYCNQEVFALGAANLFLSFFPLALPSSASITRSLLTEVMGARSRIAALGSSIFVSIILLFLWPFAKYVPIVSLASLLVFSAFHIVDRKAVALCFRATKEDAFIFLFTFSLCMIFRLDLAFIIGVLFSIVFYLRSAATPHFQEYAFDYAGRLAIIQPNAKKHSKVRIIGIGGELFFGMVDVLEGAIANIAKDKDVKVVVLRLNNVYYVDGSMCLAIVQLHEHLQSTGRYLIISGITEKVWNTLARAKVLEKMHHANFFLRDETRPQLSTWKACLRAEELLSNRENFGIYPETRDRI